ncbi:hypothetical protein H0H93_011218 [Arthromyces matolae]|nr:hypothetical protein H0H93_011218 [Arthromyces matolae]
MAEGLLYPPAEEAAQHHIGQVYAYEDVQVNGITVDTKDFIRGTLEFLPPTAEKKERTYKKSEWQGARDPYLVTVPERDDQFLFNSSAKISVEHRVLSRTLLTHSFGVPLDYFCNLSELVCVCSHIVEALGYLYFDKKTLQRDISIGNILITSFDDDNIGQGCLVDFDHAKMVTDVKKTLMEEGKCRKEENLKPVEGYLAFVTHYRLHGRSLPPNIAHNLAYGSDPLTLLYLQEFAEFVDESTLSNPRKEVPDFSQQPPQMAKRGVNLPFASPEILEERPLFPLYSKTRPQHDLRHDIESLFWCMNSICLTRSGPGGKHRDELRADFDGEITEEVRELQHINYTFFSADAKIICSNKVHLFLHPQDYDTFIIPRFHPYFNPLKPLMKKWWEMLRMAHRHPTFETLHLALRRELAFRQTPQEDPRRTAEILSDRHALLARLIIRTPLILTTNKSNQVEIGHVVPRHEGTSNLKRNRPSSASTVTEPNKRHKRH